MEKSDGSGNSIKETRDDLLVPLLILVFAACAWLVYAYINREWFAAFEQVIAWILNPTITYTPIQIDGLPWAILATLEVLLLGATCSYLVLGNERDASIKFIATLGLGFGLTGLATIILGILGDLYQLPINIIILLLTAIFLAAILYRKKKKECLSLREYLTPHFAVKKAALPPNLKFWLPPVIAIAVIFFFCFYHALLTVIVHWDATVYHATMANIMYNDHAILVIAGPSIGIEMSANFPPLFSAIGAYYYLQLGAIEDFFLRIIPPVMGILTVLATYKIGEVLAGRKFGLISALFLAVTPLFFRYSIYATSYSMLTFFCTVSILFLLLAIQKGNTKYWLTSGLFFGFATLTSYLALYLALLLIITFIAYLVLKKRTLTISVKQISVLILASLAIGGVWYCRNWIEVGNPIYPNAYTVLGGISIDPLIMQTTINGIKLSALNSFFGGQVFPLDQTFIFLTFRTNFPAISLLTILGFAIVPTIHNKKFWLIALWPLTLSFIVLSGISWGFPRHMTFALPGFAMLSALPILKVLDACKAYDTRNIRTTLANARTRLPRLRRSDLIRLGLVIVIFVAFLFPSLTLVMGGKMCEENLNDRVPDDYLWFLENPNVETWAALNELYPEAAAWQWLNENLNAGDRVATVENRIYYVKNCDNDYFFYLDGWEARQLYNITDPAKMIEFLRGENVTCIVDVLWARLHGHFNILPMANYLGSPYFPTIMDHSYNPNIYHVGPFESPITNGSTTAVSISQQGWSETHSTDGVFTQSVLCGNDSTRLFVATPTLTSLKITYLDVGKDVLSINVHNPYSQEWIHDYALIQKTNSGLWKNYELLVPLTENGFVELGLHCYTENFTISAIAATPYQSQTSIFLAPIKNCTLSNLPVSQKLTVYLPIINSSQRIEFQTNSHGNRMNIKVYEGIIQPWATSSMQTCYPLVYRAPPSLIYGEINPSIAFNTTKSVLYTLVIELGDGNATDAKVDLKISSMKTPSETST